MESGWRTFWTTTWAYTALGFFTIAALMALTGATVNAVGLPAQTPALLAILVGLGFSGIAYRRDPGAMLGPLDSLSAWTSQALRKRWTGAVAMLLVVLIGLGAYWLGRSGPENQVVSSSEVDLMEGWALVYSANRERPPSATVANQGIGWLFGAESGLNDLGAGPAYNTILMDVQTAEYHALTHHATARDWKVLTVFHRSLLPFRDVGFGKIPETRLKRGEHAPATAFTIGPADRFHSVVASSPSNCPRRSRGKSCGYTSSNARSGRARPWFPSTNTRSRKARPLAVAARNK